MTKTSKNKKIKAFIKLLNKPELLFLPGQLAFSLVFSIIPAISLLSAFAFAFNVSLDFIYNFLESLFSVRIAEYIVNIFSTQTLTFSNILVIIVALYIASNGFNSVIIASDSIYGLEPTNPIKRRVKAVFLTVMFFMLIVFILLVPVFGDFIIKILSSLSFISSSVINVVADIFNYSKWPITILLIIIFIKLIYVMSPDKLIPSKVLNKGSIFTTVGFLLVTLIYSFYVNNIARYDLYYGNFSNLIILLFWLYLLSYIFVIGISINERDYKKYIKENVND